MNVGFGKYASLDVRRLVLQHPDYVKWLLEQEEAKGRLAALQASVRRYIRAFDAKPLVKQCANRNGNQRCARPATRGTAYYSHSGLSVDLMWWCEKCDPYESGASRSVTLPNVRTYLDALSVVENYSGLKSDYVQIIKELSRAKGMPSRVTARALQDFFGP